MLSREQTQSVMMNAGEQETSMVAPKKKKKSWLKRKKEKQKSKAGCIEAPLQNPRYPWLLYASGDHICCSSTSPPYSYTYRDSSTKFPHQVTIKRVFNCCYGWLIFSSHDGNRFFIWNPVKSRLVQLPPLKLEENQTTCHAILCTPPVIATSGDLDPNCKIMLFHNNLQLHLFDSNKPYSSISYLLLRDKEKHWNTVSYAKENSIYFRSPVIFNDSIYVEDRIHHQLLVCITYENPTAIITTTCCKLPVLLSKEENDVGGLVESHGELFYIVIAVSQFCGCKEISKVESFKLDRDTLIWNKVREFDGRVFFFNSAYSVSSYDAREMGAMKSGFMFYTHDHYLHSYSYADSSISTSWLPDSCPLPILYLADTRLIDEPAVQLNLVEPGPSRVDPRKIREETGNINICEEKNGEGLLYCIPSDLMKMITRFLNPVDYLNLRSISRACRVLAPQIEWRKAGIDLAYTAPLLPWLMITDNHSYIYNFVDTKFGGRYFINIPESLMDAKIIGSNSGWLLISKSMEVCFYNPFTTRMIKLPNTPVNFSKGSSRISFSMSPTCSKCTVVATDESYRMYVFQIGWKRWHSNWIDGFILPPSPSSVFHNGSFYVLGVSGLGVVKIEDDEQISTKVLSFRTWWLSSYLQVFLLDSDGKLLLVCIGKAKGLVTVFSLNEMELSWQKVDDLGNQNLYLCKSSSFSRLVRDDLMRNTIIFPRLHKDILVCYSMDTKKYHSLGNQDDIVEYDNTRELLFASWIEPSWSWS